MEEFTWTLIMDDMMCVQRDTIDEALIYLNENYDNKFYYGEDAEFGKKNFEVVEYDPIKKERVKYWKAYVDKEIDGETVVEFRISDRVY